MKLKLILWSFAAMTFFSCTDPDLIGLEIQPEGDKITLSTYDQTPTFSLRSEKGDSIRTDETLYSLFGTYESSPFPLAIAEFSTQLLLPENDVSFGDNPIVDSAFIYLKYADCYGDTNVELTMNIQQLLDGLVLEDTFFSNQFINSEDFSSPVDISFYPRPSTLSSNEDTIASAKLKLSVKDIGQKIVDAQASDLANNDAFLDYFKGLKFKVKSTESASICYFNLLDEESKMIIYYNGNQSYSLNIGSSAARVNHFEIAEQELNFVGVQSMSGPVLQLSFNDLTPLKDSLKNKLINKATLTFQVEDNFDDNFRPHQSLSLVTKNEEGIYVFIPDFFEGATHYGGVLENNSYSFNISKYLQQMISEDSEDYIMYLLPVGNSISANRTLFDDQVILTITYTNF